MATSIGGLGSGIDTTSLVAQLMQAEGAQQSKLQGAKGALTVKSGAWTSLSTITKGLYDKAAAMQTSDKLRLTSSTSSNPSLATVTSAGTAVPGAVTFRVVQLATRHAVATAGQASPTTPLAATAGTYAVSTGLAGLGATLQPTSATAGGKHVVVISRPSPDADPVATVDGVETDLTIDDDGATVLELDGARLTFAGPPQDGTAVVGVVATTASTTLQDLARSINALGGAATATVLKDSGATPYRLVLSATASGRAGALEVSATAGLAAVATTSTLTAAVDAKLEIGDRATPLVVERPTNTVTDLVDGLTVNLVKADPSVDVTVGVTRDDDALVGKVKGLSDSVNGLLSWIATNSRYDVAAKSGGPMVGDSGVRAFAAQVTSALQTALPDGPYRTAASVGITANRTGTYDVDETALRAALKQAPEAVARVVAAVSSAVATVTKAANDANGVIRLGQESVSKATRQLQDRIDDWDVRLKAVQDRYTRQFNALDVAMKKLNSQGSWLSGQIASLPTSS